MAFPDGWGRRCALVIQASYVDSDLTNFPVLATVDNLPSEMFDADGSYPALDGGGDLRFSTDSAGSTRISCQIVSFVTDNNPANGISEVWVKAPSVSSSSNTTIYVWYNKSGESQPAADASYGSESVWDSNYKGVWHCDESAATTTDNYKDSTSNDAHATQATSSKLPTQSSTSWWGRYSQQCETSNNEFIGDVDGSKLSGNTFTLEVYGRRQDTSGTDWFNRIFSRSADDFDVVVREWDGSIGIISDNGTGGWSWYSAYTHNTDWHQYVLLSDGSNCDLRLDGSTTTKTYSVDHNDTDVALGARESSGIETGDFYYDEFRWSSVERSNAWIDATYDNVNTPGSFMVEGTPESPVTTVEGATTLTSNMTQTQSCSVSSQAAPADEDVNLGVSQSATSSIEAALDLGSIVTDIEEAQMDAQSVTNLNSEFSISQGCQIEQEGSLTLSTLVNKVQTGEALAYGELSLGNYFTQNQVGQAAAYDNLPFNVIFQDTEVSDAEIDTEVDFNTNLSDAEISQMEGYGVVSYNSSFAQSQIGEMEAYVALVVSSYLGCITSADIETAGNNIYLGVTVVGNQSAQAAAADSLLLSSYLSQQQIGITTVEEILTLPINVDVVNLSGSTFDVNLSFLIMAESEFPAYNFVNRSLTFGIQPDTVITSDTVIVGGLDLVLEVSESNLGNSEAVDSLLLETYLHQQNQPQSNQSASISFNNVVALEQIAAKTDDGLVTFSVFNGLDLNYIKEVFSELSFDLDSSLANTTDIFFVGSVEFNSLLGVDSLTGSNIQEGITLNVTCEDGYTYVLTVDTPACRSIKVCGADRTLKVRNNDRTLTIRP